MLDIVTVRSIAVTQYHYAFGIDCRNMKLIGEDQQCSVCRNREHPYYAQASLDRIHLWRFPLPRAEWMALESAEVRVQKLKADGSLWQQIAHTPMIYQGLAKVIVTGALKDPARHMSARPKGNPDAKVILYALIEAPPFAEAADLHAWASDLGYDIDRLRTETVPGREYAFTSNNAHLAALEGVQRFGTIEEVAEEIRYTAA